MKEGGEEEEEEEEEEDEEEEEEDGGEEDEEEEEEEDIGGDEELAFRWGDLQFTTGIFTPYEGVGLFPLVAALNHSCSPNCTVTYLATNQIVVLTTREIAQGEELTISYVDENSPGEARREELLQRYGFQCSCEVCSRETRRKKHKP